MDGATLVNFANGSMHWSASSAVGWSGVLLNKGTLHFTGASSLEAKSDSQGMWVDNAGAWPIVINEGGTMVFGVDSVVHINWLLWNVGGSILVSDWNMLWQRCIMLRVISRSIGAVHHSNKRE